jgi:uncharacterized membrane protein
MSAPAGSRRRARGLLFGGSLALNVFLLALVGTHLFGPMLAPLLTSGRAGGEEGPLGRMIAALPAGDAQRFRAVLDRERPAYQPEREAARVAHRALAEAVAKKPYDRAVVQQAIQGWHESSRHYAARIDQALLDALDEVSDEGRARLAQASLAEDARRQRRAE